MNGLNPLLGLTFLLRSVMSPPVYFLSSCLMANSRSPSSSIPPSPLRMASTYEMGALFAPSGRMVDISSWRVQLSRRSATCLQPRSLSFCAIRLYAPSPWPNPIASSTCASKVVSQMTEPGLHGGSGSEAMAGKLVVALSFLSAQPKNQLSRPCTP